MLPSGCGRCWQQRSPQALQDQSCNTGTELGKFICLTPKMQLLAGCGCSQIISAGVNNDKMSQVFCLPSVKAVSSTYKLLWGHGGGSHWHFSHEHFPQQPLFLVNPVRPENPNTNTVLERGLVHIHPKGMEAEEKARRQRQARLLTHGRELKKSRKTKAKQRAWSPSPSSNCTARC